MLSWRGGKGEYRFTWFNLKGGLSLVRSNAVKEDCHWTKKEGWMERRKREVTIVP